MLRMKKYLALALACILVLSLTACGKPSSSPSGSSTPPADSGTQTSAPGSSPAQESFTYELFRFLEQYDEYRYKDHINVLYLVCTTLAEYFPNSQAVFEPALGDYNISIELLGPPAYSDESMITTMESALASGKYDLILYYPITPSAITPYLQTYWDQYHVPILSYAFDPTTGSGHYYLGTSYYEAGRTLGESIVDYVNGNASYFDTLSEIPVVVYQNSAGGEQLARIEGALDVLKEDGRFKLLERYEANNEAVCLTQTETVLTTYPNVEVILTQIDNDVTGTYQTCISGVYPCSEYLSIWGFDATGAVCSLMYNDGADGYVQGSALIDHYQAADALIELIPVLVGAAKQGVMIDFTEEEVQAMGYALKDYYVTVTPENVFTYYTPSN
ncbi:MAG: substrate-binding domain-containing protein [Oscillospiraceae bacterium]|nr:substrate-binding domain-containing protein [Oscillospiraceae bacterium]